MSNIVYKTKATSVGSRSGTVVLSDNPTTFKFEKPKELGGKGADTGVNPEQLLLLLILLVILNLLIF